MALVARTRTKPERCVWDSGADRGGTHKQVTGHRPRSTLSIRYCGGEWRKEMTTLRDSFLTGC